MTKLWTTLWIIFSIILIAFPLGTAIILLTKKWAKGWKVIRQKINNLKTLDKMKDELLKQRANEIKEENNITEELTVVYLKIKLKTSIQIKTKLQIN